MTIEDEIDCAGAPRDLGLAQGSAVGDVVRRHLAESEVPSRARRLAGLRAFASGSVLGSGMGREIVRHYPHLAERMTGIARGARVPFEQLMASFVGDAAEGKEAAWPASGPAPRAAAAAQRAGGEAGVVACEVDAPESAGAWRVRRSAPEHGFRSVELVLPWLASGVAGVNESGLAVGFAPGSASPGAPRDPWCQLLVQECLQRFEEIAPALDWCLKRPSAGRGAIVLADRSGEPSLVVFEDGGPRVAAAGDGVAIAGLDDVGQARVRKQVRERGGLAPEMLETAETRVWLDCERAQLVLRRGDEERTWDAA